MIYKHFLTELAAKEIFSDIKDLIRQCLEVDYNDQHYNRKKLRFTEQLAVMNIKKPPKKYFDVYKHILGSEIQKSQTKNKHSRKLNVMFYSNIKNSCNVYLSMLPSNYFFGSEITQTKVSSFKNGTNFQKKSNSNYNQLFISIYADEVSFNNPIGVYRTYNRYWMIYGQILNLPQNLKSKLDSIFFIGAIETKHIAKYGLKFCFKPILKSIKESQKPFEMDGFEKKIKITISHFIGDAPGSHFFGGNFLKLKISKFQMHTFF